MSAPFLIDDSDPAVQYSAGWIHEPSFPPAVDHTRHGATGEGSSVWLTFYGSGIDVVIALDPTSQGGRPTTSYDIDGAHAGTATAPFAPDGLTQFNVTAFSTRSLPPGSHKLTITNMNGTSPNVFWLDYFLVYGPPPSRPESSTTATPATSPIGSTSAPTSSVLPIASSAHTSSVLPTASSAPMSLASLSSLESVSSSLRLTKVTLSTTGSPSSSTASEPTSSISPTAERRETPAIVGGVVAGVTLLVLLGTLLFFLRRRRRKQQDETGVQPSTFSIDSSSARLDSATLHDIEPMSAPVDGPAAMRDPPMLEHSAPSHPLQSVRSPTTPHTEAKEEWPSSLINPTSAATPAPAVPNPSAPLPTDVGLALAHASPELQSTALTLIRSLLQRNQSQDVLHRQAEVDSGFRIVDEASMMPPPEYTAD